MRESVIERRRVSEEALRGVKLFYRGAMRSSLTFGAKLKMENEKLKIKVPRFAG